MSLVTDRTLHPHLRDEEVLVVENAIRLAIDSIVNVLYGVNSARTREYHRMVTDRDKEIQRLEAELQVLRRDGCSCGPGRTERNSGRSRSSGDRGAGDQSRVDAGSSDAEVTTGPQECEMSLSLGLFARPSSHLSSQSHESGLLSSPGGLGLGLDRQTCTSHSSSDGSGLSDPVLVVKEEPRDMDAVLIKWEMSEDRMMMEEEEEGQETRTSPDQQSPHGTKSLENNESQIPPSEPGGFHGDHMKNRKKSVPMSELPEEVQRLKRAAWRAASRRYYARKIARRHGNPPHPPPPPVSVSFPLRDASVFSDSFADSRTSLVPELPVDSQTLQREAWRAASRRYYARKIGRHQTGALPPYGRHLLVDGMVDGMVDMSEDTQGRTDGGNGGIMCS